LPGIPVNGAATVRAAPSLLLLCHPGIDANIPLKSNIRQYFTMVWESVIIEVDKFPAGKIGALSTVEQPLFKSTSPKPTNTTVGGYYLRKTALTGKILRLQLLLSQLRDFGASPKRRHTLTTLSQPLREPLGNLLQQLRITSFASKVYQTGTAVESAWGNQILLLFTCH